MQWQCLKIDGIIYMVGLCGLSFKSFHSVSSTYFFIHCTPQWNGNSNVEEEFMMYIYIFRQMHLRIFKKWKYLYASRYIFYYCIQKKKAFYIFI